MNKNSFKKRYTKQNNGNANGKRYVVNKKPQHRARFHKC